MQNTYRLAMFFQSQMTFLSALQQGGMSSNEKTKGGYILLTIIHFYIEHF